MGETLDEEQFVLEAFVSIELQELLPHLELLESVDGKLE